MSQNIKWKFAIIGGILKYLVYAEAKYCAFEIHGEPKYYMCPRTEYCCNFGCCVSPGFQIYHLWYYWLLVIIMFLVCSGGGWWYRYWLQGRYRAAASSSIPSRSSNPRIQNTLRGPTCQAQPARITYNTARNTVLLHRMWKGPHRGATAPSYNATASGSVNYQNTNVILNDTSCPYYQLYGPPPSYETVIAQTRNKALNSSSPDLLQSNQSPLSSIPTSSNSSVLFNQSFYNTTGRVSEGTSVPYYGVSRVDNFNKNEYIKFIAQYKPIPGNSASNFLQECCYDRTSATNPASVDYSNSPCVVDRLLQHHTSSQKHKSRIDVYGNSRKGRIKFDSSNLLPELTPEPIMTSSSQLASEDCSSSVNRFPNQPELRKIQSGSLKISRRRGQLVKYQESFQKSRRLNSKNFESPSTSQQNAEESTGFDLQLNPSNSVILSINENADGCEEQHECCDYHKQQEQRSVVHSIIGQSSANLNIESKRKLDRSKSLD